MAFSLIELENFSDAAYYFLKILSMNRNDVETLNALAFLGLYENKTEQSINFLLDAIYINNNNEKLKQNLEKLRNIKDIKVFLSMNKPSDFLFFNYPKESLVEKLAGMTSYVVKIPQMKYITIVVIIFVIIFLIYQIYPLILSRAEDFRFLKSLGHGKVDHYSIQDINKLVEERAKYNIKLSEEEIKSKFSLIQGYLEEKKHNRAVILINELLNSNSSELIKERVRFLQRFLPEVSVQTIDFTPQVQEVIKIPFIYQDVYVRWSGTVANLEHKADKETVFDLLINFVDNAVVEGIAETHFEGSQNVLSGEKAAVFGQITGITIDNKIIIKGIEIQKIGK